MQYRKFGKLDWNVSVLGFGCMRLPTIDGNPISSAIDEPESIRMIRRAIDRGVNYLDTAYPYHGGNSESVTGKALEDGYRRKVRLATKSPTWFIRKPEDFDLLLNEQLIKLRTDHIDCYMLHGLDRDLWRDVVLRFGLLEKAEAAVRDGRIGHVGFSFHDSYDIFQEIVDGYGKWDFCQIQYNFMDTTNQAGTRGLRYAAGKGMAVVVMEPLLGGRLARPPAPLIRVLEESGVKKTLAELALQWVWNQPEVSVALSGMSTMAQVEEDLDSADRSAVGSLTTDESGLIDLLQAKYREKMKIPCTGCGYCLPCPNGVDIPRNFQLYNDGSIHEDVAYVRSMYERFVPEGERACACVQCRTCEERCPQKIRISEWMPEVHAILGCGEPYKS
jgi:predicted aldo/keto reductase-like oxidoreductase